MEAWLYLTIMFLAKVLDNTLGTAKTILVQKNRCVLAGIALGLSNFIYLCITKNIVTTNSDIALIVVSVASGVGCCLAVAISNKFSKEKTYVNVIMSDDMEAMRRLRTFLARHKITNVVSDSYTMDWQRKTLTITAYAETKEQSKKIDNYLAKSETKFKRMVEGKRVKA